MGVEVVVLPGAERDIEAAYEWYEDRRAGLGEEFLDQIDRCFGVIAEHPAHCPVVHGTLRRALSRRFPYAVFYEAADHVITVVAVFHVARDPKKWRRRAEG
jgi:plasmid stabilization system protein ParE